MKIVIPFVQIDAHNPNLSSRKTISASDTYFECIVIAFASIKHWNPKFRLQLTTNIPVREPFAYQLKELNVETKIIDYAFNPPIEFGNSFRGCFYLFDAIIAESEDVLYIDPDVVCVGAIPQDIFKNCEIGALDLRFADNKEINGISPSEARKIYSQMYNRQELKSHNHYGGEAVFISKLVKDSLVSDIQKLWIANTSAAVRGESFLTTEEHILSLIFSDYLVSDLNSLILRIWTTMHYNKIEGGTLEVQKPSLWHLPSEKSFGFHTAYRLNQKNQLFKFSDEAKNQSDLRKIFGIDKSKVSRILTRILS